MHDYYLKIILGRKLRMGHFNLFRNVSIFNLMEISLKICDKITKTNALYLDILRR